MRRQPESEGLVKILMLIICFVPAPNGELREAWRIEQSVPAEVCWKMNQIFSGGGKAAATTVRCGKL
jgi:hypothetical protein